MEVSWRCGVYAAILFPTRESWHVCEIHRFCQVSHLLFVSSKRRCFQCLGNPIKRTSNILYLFSTVPFTD